MGKPSITLTDFWKRVNIRSENECWNWVGYKQSEGYGCIVFHGKQQLAHRIAYETTYGKIPEGIGYHGTVIRHSCDNRACCNPKHLLSGTIADNNRDIADRGRRKGSRHAMAKLTDEKVLAIRDAFAKGIPEKDLSQEFKISRSHICNIVNGKSWRNL